MLNVIVRINKIFSNDKDRQVIQNMLGAFLIKGGALLISLVTLPAYIRYFDNQLVLGLWFTIISVMNWILSFDFGIGNGLRNKLVESIMRNERKESKEFISSAYTIISIIVLITIAVGMILSQLINWNQIFNIPSDVISSGTMLYSVRCVFIGIMLQFMLRLITSILYAMQKSALTNLLVLLTSIAQLIFVLVAPKSDVESNLRMLSVAYIICINVPLIIATIIIFQTSLKNCAPSLRYYNKKKGFDVLSLGGIFFYCQIMYMIITTTNEYLIARFLGNEFVVEYQVYNRLFTVIGSLFMLALTPLWSAITKALHEKDSEWITKTYKRLNLMAILAVCLEFAMIPFLQIIINIWLGQSAIKVDYFYAVSFAAFGSVFIYQSVLSTIVCGMGKMKLQAIVYTAGAFLKFFMIYFGMQLVKSWIVVVLANLMIFLPYIIIQPGYIKRAINEIA